MRDLRFKVDTFFKDREDKRGVYMNRLYDTYLGRITDANEVVYNQTK